MLTPTRPTTKPAPLAPAKPTFVVRPFEKLAAPAVGRPTGHRNL